MTMTLADALDQHESLKLVEEKLRGTRFHPDIAPIAAGLLPSIAAARKMLQAKIRPHMSGESCQGPGFFRHDGKIYCWGYDRNDVTTFVPDEVPAASITL